MAAEQPEPEANLARNALGEYGERVAVRHLLAQGLVVIDRNWRCAAGELDILALDGDQLVVCEVKTRRTDRYGGPLAAVTPAKLDRLRRLAAMWLAAHPIQVGSIRFDVIAVRQPARGRPRVEHVAGVQ